MLNQCTFAGRLTADPEIRQVGDSTVASCLIAVDRDRPNGEGEREADYISCTAWNQTAKFLEKYFVKGDAIIVTGRLRTSSWIDDSGTKRRSTEINIQQIYFGESNVSRKARKGCTGEENTLPDV